MNKALPLVLTLGLTLPGAAAASGSWAVPRFTPTWAELQRDLALLGLQKRRPRPVAKKVASPPTAVATTATPEQSPGEPQPASTPGEEVGAAAGQRPPLINLPAWTGGNGFCMCDQPQPRCADGPAAAAPSEATPVKAGTPAAPPDQAGQKKKKKPPGDNKKLDRKKYWWQDD